MADLITVTWRDTVSGAFRQLPRQVESAIRDTVTKTADDLFQRIKFATPRDTGRAAAGWQRRNVGTTASPVVEIFNNVPYINVLEFGGYPVIPASRARTRSGGFQRGNAILDGGYPPGPRTQRAPGGDPPVVSNVSRQAPQGMARKQLDATRQQFLFDLQEALDRAFASL